MRRLRVDDKASMFEVFFRVDSARRLESSPNFEVSLPVEILGFDKTEVVRVGGREDDDVGRDLFVVSQQNEIANFEFFPERLLGSFR